MTTFAALLETDTERWRYQNLLRTLTSWRALFAGQRVLDFGAAWGTSAVALIEAGAGEVVGVEPDQSRVEKGRALIAEVAPGAKISLLYVGDTSSLPFRDAEFTFVLANGVLEHIPQPRDPYVRELWRVLAHDGHLMVTETPNTYWPCDTHTTGLWFNHWLPRDVAHRRAVRRGRFRSNRHDWATSGWRGVGYRELVRSLAGYRLVPDNTRFRHRLLAAIGLPASLIDPDPIWILRKTSGAIKHTMATRSPCAREMVAEPDRS